MCPILNIPSTSPFPPHGMDTIYRASTLGHIANHKTTPNKSRTMSTYPDKFAQLLTEGIHRVRIREHKNVQIVQDELGYALGREGGSAIEYWRKGHVPAKRNEIEQLGRDIVQRGQLERKWLHDFLASADYPTPDQLCDELFGSVQTSAAQKAEAEENRTTLAAKKHGSSTTLLAPLASLAPYIVGPPITHPGKFYGRNATCKRIFGAWRHSPLQNVAIVGPKRSGKTSLLHYVRQIAQSTPDQLRPDQSSVRESGWLSSQEEIHWVYVDFQDVRMGSQKRLFAHILNTLEIPVPAECDMLDFIDAMIDHVDSPTVLILDEIGAALEAPELDMPFWWSLRSLGTNLTNGNLGYLIASHEPPMQVAEEQGKPSPFFNIFGHVIQLGPIQQADARALIASAPIAFDTADIEWILLQSKCWPALLQTLCHTRLATLEDGVTNESWRAEALIRMQPYEQLLKN